MVRAAIVGLGWQGMQVVRRMHSSRRLKVAAALDPSGADADFAAQYGLRLTAHWDELLCDPDIEAIILCAPHPPHVRQILDAASAGKHVFCGTPLAPAEAERAAVACRAAGVVLGIGHERRFEPAATEIRRMMREGVLGAIMHVEAHVGRDALADAPASPAGAVPAATAGWDFHLTDLCLDLFGPVTEVYAQTSRQAPGRGAPVVAAHLRFASGATGSLNAVPATPHSMGMTLFGSEGWCEIRNHSHPGVTRLTYQSRKGHSDSVELEWEDAVRANLDAFADAVAGGDLDPVAHERAANIAMIEAIHKSAARNMPVPIDSLSGTRRPVAAIA